MAVYKIFASADTTLYSAYPSQNAGLDEILEVACENSLVPSEVLLQGSGDDLRRALVKFSPTDISTAYNLVSGSSWAANLRLYLADASGLSSNYNVEVHQVSSSWDMGTGKFLDNPAATDGATWYTSGSYIISSSGQWLSPIYFLTPGGGNSTGLYCTQSFEYKDDKDINADVTTIISSWFSGSSNNGFLVKLPSSIENNSGSYVSLKYFSVDTHTIYPPTLDIKWDDSSYSTGSLFVVSDNSTILTVANNIGTFKNDTVKYVFRVNARDKFPTRYFVTSSIYTVNKALPATSYWAIQDVKTEEMVIDFDSTYTKLSCDSNGSYFSVYMNGLEPERYYKVLVKVNLPTGESIDIDNNNTFKIVR
jgi:hypothetical protein